MTLNGFGFSLIFPMRIRTLATFVGIFIILASIIIIPNKNILLPARALSTPCNCVIFRFDDVQDFNFPAVTNAVMDQFITKNQSLNPAMVMNHLGTNPAVVNKVDDGYKKGLFELQGHGWDHVFFNGTGLDQQTTWLSQMNAKIQDMFGRGTNQFTPPLGPFDTDTLTAMRNLGLRIISSEEDIDGSDRYPPFKSDGTDIKDSFGIYHVPATAKFYDYATGIGVKVPVSQLLSRIDASISKNGWAVVVMHPPDFGVKANGKSTNQVDQNEINDLNTIIDTEVSNGRPITTFSNLVGLTQPPLHDVHPPSITAPPDVSTVSSGGNLTQVSLGNATVTDMVDPSPVVTNDAPSDGFPIGTTKVTWTARDFSGNSASAVQYVTVTSSGDTTPPNVAITSPASGSIYGPSAGVTVNVTGTSSDSNSGVRMVQTRTDSTTLTSATPKASNDWSTWTSAVTFTQSGSNNIIAKATDWSGNVKTVKTPVTVVLSNNNLNSTTLTLNTISSVPWSNTVKVTGTLTDSNASGAGIGGKTISFTGTGATNLASAVTNPDGTFTSTGAAPNTVGTWRVQAHYAGDATSYKGSDSTTNSYNTLKHVTNLVTTTVNTPWSMPISFTAALTDTSAGGTPISGKTIHLDGTGVSGVASDPTTNSNGSAIATGTSPSTVNTGWTFQSHFAGDSLYNAKDSIVKTYSTLKHVTNLVTTTVNTPWSMPISFTAALTDTSAGGTPISGKTIHLDGTGVSGVASDPTTNSNGSAIATGTSSSTVNTGWTFQSHFAGDSLYNAKDSIVKTYSTLKHNTDLSLIISPTSVSPAGSYQVSGLLKDTTITTSPTTALSGKTISFTATSPITISNAVTDSNGNYSVSNLNAPSKTGSYTITAKFAGDSLYNAKNSLAGSLTVTTTSSTNTASPATASITNISPSTSGPTTTASPTTTGPTTTPANTNGTQTTSNIGTSNNNTTTPTSPARSITSLPPQASPWTSKDITNSAITNPTVGINNNVNGANSNNTIALKSTLQNKNLMNANSNSNSSSNTNSQLQGQLPQSHQIQSPSVTGNSVSPYPQLYPYPYQLPYQQQQQPQQQQNQQLQTPQQQQQQLQPSQHALSPLSSSTLALPPPIANAGVSQIVQANTNVILDGRNSYIPTILQQQAPNGANNNNNRMIIAYQWTQVPVGLPVNITGANTPTPMFKAPMLPYDTTLAFSLRVMSNDGMISSNPAIVYVMVKHYTGASTAIGNGGTTIQQQPTTPKQQPLSPFQQQQSLPPIQQQQIIPSPQQQQQPSVQQRPLQQSPSVYSYPYPYTYLHNP
jgi:peptidoglycan/xylan/chitin deacetylase (PgdA/CDA1 family)